MSHNSLTYVAFGGTIRGLVQKTMFHEAVNLLNIDNDLYLKNVLPKENIFGASK